MRALITGITGQDGSYLADFLLERGYEVWGLIRPCSQPRRDNISHLIGKIGLIGGNLLDQGSLIRALEECRPHEVYNLAAQSFVPDSWREPVSTAEVNGLGVVRMLEAIRNFDTSIRFYQASTSEMFGNGFRSATTTLKRNGQVFGIRHNAFSANSPFYPRSPYGVAKVYAHHATVNYRESYGLFACCGILFNHESVRRGYEFVTRYVSRGVAAIVQGKAKTLPMGAMDVVRDWGHAKDYVRAMWMMLQQDEPDDFVIGTGIPHTVRDVVNVACRRAGLDPASCVVNDTKLMRPAEVNYLLADPGKARAKLGWTPEISFESMICEMVDYDTGWQSPWIVRPNFPT